MASFLSDSDTDEALVRANAAEFGLSAQVWNNDTATISAPCPQPHGRQAWGEHLPVGPPDPFPSAG